jgi:hypothetical protein
MESKTDGNPPNTIDTIFDLIDLYSYKKSAPVGGSSGGAEAAE